MSNETLFLKVPRIIIKFFGLWLPPQNHRLLHQMYLTFIMSTQFSFLLFELFYVFSVLGDIEKASEASYLLLSEASICFKVVVFLVNLKPLKELFLLMESEIFAPQTKAHNKCLKVLAKRITRFFYFYTTSAVSTTTLWGMAPLFDDAQGRSFPFKIWMPVSPELTPYYEVGYFYQIASIYISAFIYVAVDGVAISMIMFGCAELDIIMDKLSKLKPLPKFIKVRNRKEKADENYKLLTESIQQHQAVIQFVKKIEDVFHAIIFFQLTGTIVIICITGLRITILSRNSLQFLSMCNYMVTMLSQVFLFCWCGNELTIRSEKIREVLYQSAWYEQEIKFNRSLCIAMERMKQPIVFKAGHYITLSRQTFVSILRSSYSYFAVLNTVNNK